MTRYNLQVNFFKTLQGNKSYCPKLDLTPILSHKNELFTSFLLNNNNREEQRTHNKSEWRKRCNCLISLYTILAN